MDLPFFKYHPHPLQTGAIVESENICMVCNQPRGYVYRASPYRMENHQEQICPWCIADGSAHTALDIEFTDLMDLDDRHALPDRKIDLRVAEEVSRRTPAFDCLQDHHWVTHCNDACAFLGRAGGKEILEHHPDLIGQIEEDYVSDDVYEYTVEEYLERLEIDGSEEAYVFQCLHCGHKECYVEAD